MNKMVTMVTNSERAKAYNFLSSIYLCQPTRAAIKNWKALLSGEVLDSLSELKEALDQIDLNAEEELEELLWEYTRLFIGPYRLPCPPWESVYTSPARLLMQEAYDQMENLYKEMSLTLNHPDLLPDHLGVELNFLAVLYGKITGNPEREHDYMEFAQKFLNEHLRRWVPQFTLDMERAANFLIYKCLARVTRDFITNQPNLLDHSRSLV